MKRNIVILFLIALVFCCNNVSALEAEICEYSKEYLEWTKLSEEEKAKTEVIPDICKTDKKSSLINNITSNSFVRAGNDTYPSSYSLVDLGQVSPVRNQQTTGTCWAFTSNEMVESNLLKAKGVSLSFSSRHLEYHTSRTFTNGINPYGLNREVDSGGNFFMSTNYYKNNYGPILESAMPFENNMNLLPLSSIQNKVQAVDVNTTFLLTNGESGCSDSVKNTIKSHLMNYGAVGTLINMIKNATYYNESTAAYYYDGLSPVNHAVTIVGWDDNYQVSNFSSSKRPSSPGAWIVKNSYGTSFGKNGYFYISYNDSRVCKTVSGVNDVDFDFPTKLYTYDKYGYNTSVQLVDSSTMAYVATKFNKPATVEYLSEITVGAYHYANVELYVIPTNKTLDISNATKVGNLTIPYGGYATYKLKNKIALTDTTFYIIAKYTYQSTSGPAVSFKIDDSPWDIVTANPGESYLSINGKNYTDLIDALGGYVANAAITAGTTTTSENIIIDTSKNYEVYNNGITETTIPVTTSNIANNTTIQVNIIRATDRSDQSSKFEISNNVVNSNAANIKVKAKSTTPVGNYIIQIKYNGCLAEANLVVLKTDLVTNIVVNDIIIEVSKEQEFTPIVEPSNATNKTLKITSSDTSVVTVTNNKIKGLKEGVATLTIETTDGSKIKKQITVTVVKMFTPESNYELNELNIVNVSPETSYQDVLDNFIDKNTVKIYNTKDKEVSSGNVGTGFVVKKTVAGKEMKFKFVVLGDATGDGLINSSDLLRVRQHLLELITLKDENFIAADITGNDVINSSDLLRVRQHLLGINIIGEKGE